MKLGIMGTGKIVHDMLKMVHDLKIEKVNILATEATKDEAVDLIEKYHLDEYYVDFDSFINSDIDTVYVALPNNLHYIFAKKAIEAGKNTIIEKPVTINSDELKDLKSLANKNNVYIFEAMPAHYLPAFKSIKEDISKLGDIKIVSFNYSQYSSRYDKFKNGEILPAFDGKKAGGALMDINIYNINGVVSFFGKPKEFKYYANIEKDVDTSGVLMMDYGQFKAICVAAKDCKAPYSLYIQGDKGYITVDSPFNQTKAYTLFLNNGTNKKVEFEPNVHRLYYEFKEFIRVIDEKDEKTLNDIYKRSLLVCEILEEARKSAGLVC